MKTKAFRPGTSLIEMILFMAFFAISSGAVLTLFLESSQQRKMQTGIALVDQTGVQMVQTLSRRIRASERILYPTKGNTGTILVLQMTAIEDDPTIITVLSGAFLAQENNVLSALTSSGAISIENFQVSNTSPKDDAPSVFFSFDASIQLGIPSQPQYVRTFETAVSIFPDDQIQGNTCGCPLPYCENGILNWDYCNSTFCMQGSSDFLCP